MMPCFRRRGDDDEIVEDDGDGEPRPHLNYWIEAEAERRRQRALFRERLESVLVAGAVAAAILGVGLLVWL